MLKALIEKTLSGRLLTRQDALIIAQTVPAQLEQLLAGAEAVKRRFRGDSVDLCAIVNAKSGECPEDCTYCAQSCHNRSQIEVFPFVGRDEILRQARLAREGSVARFSIVTSGKRPDSRELKEIAAAITDIRKLGMGTCASLGLLGREELSFLKDAGLERCHNNLETSERFFPSICSTHKFRDKISTIEDALSVGLDVCSGGIFGMGESWQDRIDLAFTVRDYNIVSMPINLLNPIPGTRLDHMPFLDQQEALKVISLMRMILPDREIRVCGGRSQTLGDSQNKIFRAGADSMMTGNYLVTAGTSYEDDLKMILLEGLSVRC